MTLRKDPKLILQSAFPTFSTRDVRIELFRSQILNLRQILHIQILRLLGLRGGQHIKKTICLQITA